MLYPLDIFLPVKDKETFKLLFNALSEGTLKKEKGFFFIFSGASIETA